MSNIINLMESNKLFLIWLNKNSDWYYEIVESLKQKDCFYVKTDKAAKLRNARNRFQLNLFGSVLGKKYIILANI